VIHRDIKPENFLKDTGKNGNCSYVTDLGSLRSIVPTAVARSSGFASPRITLTIALTIEATLGDIVFEILNWLTRFQQSVRRDKARRRHGQGGASGAHTSSEKGTGEARSAKTEGRKGGKTEGRAPLSCSRLEHQQESLPPPTRSSSPHQTITQLLQLMQHKYIEVAGGPIGPGTGSHIQASKVVSLSKR